MSSRPRHKEVSGQRDISRAVICPCQVEGKEMARFLVTGIAGFIGYSLARLLLKQGHFVVGIDSFTPYYDVTLKRSRAAALNQSPDCHIHEFSIEDAVKFTSSRSKTRSSCRR